MPRRSRHFWTALGFAWLLAAAGTLSAASRTIEISFDKPMEDGTGEIRGTETYSLSEHEALVALKRAGDVALTDCLLDPWETRKALSGLDLTVSEVTSTINNNRYELTWRAKFSKLPSSFQQVPSGVGPVIAMGLTPTDDKAQEYLFAAKLALPQRPPAARGVSPLDKFTFTLRVHFPGTVNRDVVGKGQIDHTGETVSWTMELASLRTNSVDVSAKVIPGRASEQKYWLILMVSLTVLVAVIMLGLLRRGAGNSKKAPTDVKIS